MAIEKQPIPPMATGEDDHLTDTQTGVLGTVQFEQLRELGGVEETAQPAVYIPRHATAERVEESLDQAREAVDAATYAKVYRYMQSDRPAALRLILNEFRQGQLTDYVRYEQARNAQQKQAAENDARTQSIQESEPGIEHRSEPRAETSGVPDISEWVALAAKQGSEASGEQATAASAIQVVQNSEPTVEHQTEPQVEASDVPDISKWIALAGRQGSETPKKQAAPVHSVETPAVGQEPTPIHEPGNIAVKLKQQQESSGEMAPDSIFEQARHTSKKFSESFVLNLLDRTLEVVPGDRALIVKSYLDNIPAQEQDVEMYRSPEKLAKYHDQLADFVTSRLKILASLDEQGKSVVRQAKGAFIEQTAEGFNTVLDYFQKFAAVKGDFRARPKLPRKTFDFHGLNVTTTDGKIDLLEEKMPNVKANLYMQRELTGLFVHWSSESYTRARFARKHPEITKRIYLNPQLKDAVGIFDEVTSLAEEQGLMVKGKILHRSLEGLGELAKDTEQFGLRGDGIVLYAGEDADKLLDIVVDVQKRHHDAFKGRRTSRIPFRIGDGVAIGEEPDADGASLTSHRAELIEKVAEETNRRLGKGGFDKLTDSQRAKAHKTFVAVYNELAPQYNISTHNIAFNATPVAKALASAA